MTFSDDKSRPQKPELSSLKLLATTWLAAKTWHPIPLATTNVGPTFRARKGKRNSKIFLVLNYDDEVLGIQGFVMGNGVHEVDEVWLKEDEFDKDVLGYICIGGGWRSRGDVAYGGSLEATLRDKDHPLDRFLSTVGLSVMDWHGDLALGWNAQSQIPIGRFTNLISRVNLNNKGSGQVSVRLNSSEQLQIALVSLVPLFSKLLSIYQDRDLTY
ncbi:hypothetical protein QVD17_18262 [Tagetes erecta]|uniref:Translocase of chloroplast 159/132 membrane anchor domain-containing protein n=1 Tax=Tagetes erecta TaxID=13708 RepID=A0AAD8NNU2_TARER|nr:hypothetical protein QVD17_18262 [Tagetes erecta]